ncbi:hypothetical protein P154DRAFT_623234 [Amniculicola lignicola CBS 123094]|uniref:Membrane insertase YidC/Oxa/ALB C-terminal domain-containing protein n=1 Tax=Amniculicola lignicola CBS 123094 TaxID=1392246 RepID=A0A6A5W3H7_9PLEO|nr:hypothetical protein P154DRAFT_623234 [Amniculicola lignicola CBS 123094]
MIPSRGLRPAHFASLAPRQSLYFCGNGSRQFSLATQKTTLLSSRAGSRAAKWTNGAIASPNALSSIASVRHASWYAPWSWKFPTPNDARSTDSASPELLREIASSEPQPVITTQTPELSPATLEKDTAMESTGAHEAPAPYEGLLAEDPASYALPQLDPAILLEKPGFLKELGLDYGWGPTAFYEWMLEHIYLDLGLGWGSSIVASVFAIRVLTFYFNVRASDAQAKNLALQPVTSDLMDKMRAAQTEGNVEVVRKYQAQVREVYKSAGTSMWAAFRPMGVQMVLGYGAFRFLRGMANLPVPSMENSGWLWINNLSVSDPTYIMPLLSALFMHMFSRLGGDTGMVTTGGMKLMMHYGVPGLMFVFSWTMPAGLQIYFLFSSVTAVSVAYTLRRPAIRRLFRLTPWPTPVTKAFWTKAWKDKIPMNQILGKNGQVRPELIAKFEAEYQAGTRAAKQEPTKNDFRGMKLKPGAAVSHLAAPGIVKKAPIDRENPDRDVDFDDGPPKGIGAKIDWYRRNYKFGFVMRRLTKTAAERTGRSDFLTPTGVDRARARAEEFERKRRERRR